VIYGSLGKPFGAGKIKIALGTVSITGTGSLDTGLKSVSGAIPAVQNAEDSLPSNATAAVTSINSGTVNLVVISHDSAANAVSSTAKTVAVLAWGE